MADKRLGVKSRTARPSLVGRRARCTDPSAGNRVRR